MNVCSKCKTEYDNNLVFCPKCGSKLVKKIIQSYCVYCGKKVDSCNEFCSFCGTRLLKFNKRKEISSIKVCSHCNVKYHYDFRFCPTCGHKMLEIKSSFFKFMTLLVSYLLVFVLIFSFAFTTFKNKSDVYPIIFETLKLEKPSEGDNFWFGVAGAKRSNPYKRNNKEILSLFISTFINGYEYVSAVDKIESLYSAGLYVYEEQRILSLIKQSKTNAYVFLRDKAILNENNVSWTDFCYAGAALSSISSLYFVISFILVTCVWYVLFYKLKIG